MDDGLIVRMNLDGSASWQGRSADELLDEFLEPFQKGCARRRTLSIFWRSTMGVSWSGLIESTVKVKRR